MPAGAAAPVTPAGYNASLAQPPAAAADGLSAEQAAFVQRKAAEQASAAGDAANPVPYSQRKPIAQPGLVGSLAKQQPSVAPANPSPRPSFRPSSRQPTSSPAAAKWDHATRVMPAGSPPPVTPARYMHVTPEEAALLSKEQAEFLERKRAGGK
ncbi:hypothetical protein COHA_010696 [Chlorella ohadii]|uniref:Uncharacterized protein n=1 Tax=Chlorella ohadii TaxID=2649997 RepID=A0AAD5H099_9CHLO|nr:hypothetical protein COHA_010696 [Chlorella ohadii]